MEDHGHHDVQPEPQQVPEQAVQQENAASAGASAIPAKKAKSPETASDAMVHGPQRDGEIEPDHPAPQHAQDQSRFGMPRSFEERFLITKHANQRELFRAYDDERPAIVDKGDKLSTGNADRSTAMDMIELAAHRSWQGIKARGPEDFRREMWIEGTAHGMQVQGYRPSEQDRKESDRRAQLIGDRVIERLDDAKSSHARHSSPAPSASAGDRHDNGKTTNVIDMPNYEKGVRGSITETGTAPYRDRKGAKDTPFVELELASGQKHKVWGVSLPDIIRVNRLQVGDTATLRSAGTQTVALQIKDPKTGEISERDVQRRNWVAEGIERAEAKSRKPAETAVKMNEPLLADQVPVAPVGPAAQKSNLEASGMPGKDREQHPAADRLEDRIRHFEPGDEQVKGAASIVAKTDAALRHAGVPEEDRERALSNLAGNLAESLRAGKTFDVQKLPNVTREQEAEAEKLSKAGQQTSAEMGKTQIQQQGQGELEERQREEARGRER
ncbi:hypothetical protein KUV26_21185 [Leisingera daeponensis]|uniref:Large polyvalent protein-associated domain-containing protein n=1 Tax=Leisingera daeponensis TaxID=405746 RepID=A0ABS7NL83_9RHOB|nr:LPD7 domain-containing protein [Leisingera daeponensis]MBY6141955.1 hypothetical protein [Leisingera daeponensis]